MRCPTPQPVSYNPNSLCATLARLLQGPARHQVGGHSHREGEDHRQRDDGERDPALAHQQGGFWRHRFHRSKTLGASASKAILPGRILTADSTASSDGKGQIDRKESLLTNVAGVVTQVLPNGNLVSKASRRSA